MSQPCGGRDDQLGPRHRSSDFETLARQYYGLGDPAPCEHARRTRRDDPGSWQRLFDWWGQLFARAGAGRAGRCRRPFREQAGSW